MIKHPWHEAPAGFQPPEFVNSVIEILTGISTKYEVDKESGLLKLDRVLFQDEKITMEIVSRTLGYYKINF